MVWPVKKKYNLHGIAGLFSRTTSHIVGHPQVSIYNVEQSGVFDPDGGPWVTVCDTHGALVNYSSLRAARRFSSRPNNWCEACQMLEDWGARVIHGRRGSWYRSYVQAKFKNFQRLLEALAPYVYVVGSYARNQPRYSPDNTGSGVSDLDLYIKSYEDRDGIEQTYINEVIRIINAHRFTWDSILVGCVHVEGDQVPVMLDMSTLFNVPDDAEPFSVNVFGVEMLAVFDRGEPEY